MICKPCKADSHDLCPSRLIAANSKPTGLSSEGEAIQNSGLCPCQHRAQFRVQESAIG